MDCEIWVHPLQPDAIMVKNADNLKHALQVVLHHSYVNFPGWFLDIPQINSASYHDKYLVSGFPLINEVTSWQ